MNETSLCPACRQPVAAEAWRCAHCTQRLSNAPAFHRNVPEKMLGGVAAALALHFGWDVTVMRVFCVVSVAVTGGASLWGYALLWLLTPYELGQKSPAMRFVDWAGQLFSSSPPPSDLQHRP